MPAAVPVAAIGVATLLLPSVLALLCERMACCASFGSSWYTAATCRSQPLRSCAERRLMLPTHLRETMRLCHDVGSSALSVLRMLLLRILRVT